MPRKRSKKSAKPPSPSNQLFEQDEAEKDIGFGLNAEYAKRFEHNKMREEMHKLEAKLNEEGSSDSESETEDEDGELVTPSVDAAILSTLVAIKSKDSRIYDTDINVFEQEEQKANSRAKDYKLATKISSRNEKPIYLKDYHRQNLMNGTEFEEEPTFVEQQEKLKKEAVEGFAYEEEKEDEIFLKFKSATSDENAKDYQAFLTDNISLEEIKEDETDKFLIDYVLNRKWLSNQTKEKSITEMARIAEEDEDFEEKAEEFEEAAKSKIDELLSRPESSISYGRNIPGSLRRLDSKRKLQRDERKERKRLEKEKVINEINRLKHLKEKTLREKVELIKSVAGDDVNIDLEQVDLDEDFDPEKWDSKMQSIFNEEYYKKATSKDKKLALLEIDREEKDVIHNTDENVNVRSRKRKHRENNAKIDEYVTEKYNFGFEDVMDDGFVTRFKYVKTKPDDFGLDPVELFQADDTELNEYIGIKKLFPYRSKEVQERDRKKYCKRKRLKEWRKRVRTKL